VAGGGRRTGLLIGRDILRIAESDCRPILAESREGPNIPGIVQEMHKRSSEQFSSATHGDASLAPAGTVNGDEGGGRYHISKSRVEALVDGIFAFAMTLLVITISVPVLSKEQAAAELPARIAAMEPEFLMFFIAFFILASFWIVHHRHFHIVRTVDRTVVRINLLILAFIVLFPFSTNISGDYDTSWIAVNLFHLNLMIIGILFSIHWYYLIHHPRLLFAEPEQREADCTLRLSLMVPLTALSGIALSSLSPSYSMMVYFLIPLLHYLIPKYWCPSAGDH
jgi:uncharacterized membrane protein